MTDSPYPALSFQCSRCGQTYDSLDNLRLHLCPYLAAKARGFTPEQARVVAQIEVMDAAKDSEASRK